MLFRFCAFSLFGILLSGAIAAQADDACRTEGPTLVCKNGERKYRVIAETPSPSGRYAIAWVPQDRNVGEDKFSERNGALNYLGPVENHLVRLDDGKLLRKLRGEHFGDEQSYNHTEQLTHWSPDSTWMIEIDDSKWTTPVADVYRIGKDGEVSDPFSLMPFVRKVALEHLSRVGTKINASRYVDSLKNVEIDNDGAIKLRLLMQIIKTDGDFEFDMRIKAAPRGGRTLDGKVISLKRAAD